MYRIGVDVGGTNTDAAILDILSTATPSSASRGVLASSKTPTTADITSGIQKAVKDVIDASSVDTSKVLSLAIGTTHFVNAVVQADPSRLNRVAVIRLCGPFTKMIPPFSDFPPELQRIMKGPIYYLDGGFEITGSEISPLDPEQIRSAVDEIKAQGINTVAIVGVFSPLDHEGNHEERCKAIILEKDPELSVVCSHDIGNVGLLERENATILNASILSLARRTVGAFADAMSHLSLSCPLYLTQNDGTLTDARTAADFPIKTFASGPTNSLTGAVFLARLDEADTKQTETQKVVVDIGGTTTDVCGLLSSGFPRQASNFVDVGGVRTAFSMPEVLSIGLGGGSKVSYNADHGEVLVGPDSVGYQLTEKSTVFGGSILTATDIAVATGTPQLGDPKLVSHLDETVVVQARRRIKKMLENVIDNMKVSSLPVVAILVGGGSILHMDDLNGVTKCIIPPHHGAANAIGAAIAKVAGEVDVIEILDFKDEDTIVEGIKRKAIEATIARGADPSDIKIVDVEKLPLQYTGNKATRIKVKAVGKLDHSATTHSKVLISQRPQASVEEEQRQPAKGTATNEIEPSVDIRPSRQIDIALYRPNVRKGIWYVSAVDLEFISLGVGVLGTGGGGSSYLQYLDSLENLRNAPTGRMRVVRSTALNDNDLCAFGSWYGAPSVSVERLPAGSEINTAIDFSVKLSNHEKFQALVAGEIGGGNGLVAFPSSAFYDVPVVDGDLMGRAYPTIEHGTTSVYGQPLLPCLLADARGNVGVTMQAESTRRIEGMLRTTCIELGLSTAVAVRPLTGDVIKKYIIPNTLSQSWYIGRAIHLSRRTKADMMDSIFEVTPGKLIFAGKIVDVKRDTSLGYTMGSVLIEPDVVDDENSHPKHVDAQKLLKIPFQNEFLYAALVNGQHSKNTQSAEEVVVTVPDLISVLSSSNGEAIGTQDLRYGLKVKVIAMPAHPLWTDDPRGLAIGGPRYFGLGQHVDWQRGRYGLGSFGNGPKSVIDEFNVDESLE